MVKRFKYSTKTQVSPEWLMKNKGLLHGNEINVWNPQSWNEIAWIESVFEIESA